MGPEWTRLLTDAPLPLFLQQNAKPLSGRTHTFQTGMYYYILNVSIPHKNATNVAFLWGANLDYAPKSLLSRSASPAITT